MTLLTFQVWTPDELTATIPTDIDAVVDEDVNMLDMNENVDKVGYAR